MAAFKVLKGSTDVERLASADGLIEALDRKVGALERRQGGGAAQDTLRRRDTRLEVLEGKVEAILKHLGLEAQENTTSHDLVPAQGDQG